MFSAPSTDEPLFLIKVELPTVGLRVEDFQVEVKSVTRIIGRAVRVVRTKIDRTSHEIHEILSWRNYSRRRRKNVILVQHVHSDVSSIMA